MKELKVIIILSIICATRVSIFAQVSDSVIHLDESAYVAPDTSTQRVFPAIFIKSSMTDDGLMLRWAPNTKEIWLDGIDFGYILEKYIEGTDGDSTGSFVAVEATPIRPWPLDKWKSIVSEDKPYCAAAAQCIYAKEEDGPSGFAAKSDHQDNLFGFNLLSADLDRDAAIASGLGYLIKDVDTGSFDIYRIRLAQPLVSSYRDTSLVYTLARKMIYNPIIMDTVLQKENAAVVQWYTGASGAKPTAYYIERSEDNENFTRLNKQPYLDIKTNVTQNLNTIKYIDSLDENYKPYYYRVIGINSFAQESVPSRSVMAMGEDQTPPNTPINVTSQETKEGLVIINWDWVDLNEDGDMKGFYIEKSTNSKGPFERLNSEILSPKTKKYLDKNPDAVSTNFYKIIAEDENGNKSESTLSFAITEDKTPPAPPTMLEGEVDSTGMLLITWAPPKDKDVRGYLVHFSNGKEMNYAVIPGPYLTQPFYIDTMSLNTLTESIYYYVVAIDLSYNPSEASEILEIKKPDIVPPTASIFNGYKVDMGAINIEWIRSTSADVEKVELWRRSNDKEWAIISEFDDSKQAFADKSVKEGVFYEYTLKTYDDAGNVTMPQKNLSLKARKAFFIDGVTNAKVSNQKDSSTLSWSYDKTEGVTFIIYKGSDKDNLQTVTYVNGSMGYTDLQFTKKSDKIYAIKVKGPDGRTSKLVYIEP